MSAPVTIPDAQYLELEQGCGLVDRSELGKLMLTGPAAAEFLNGQLTNEILGLRPGEGCYAALLTHKGKMLADLRVLAAADPADSEPDPGALLLVCERPALQALFDAIRRFRIGFDVELHKRTLERALLSLIGPGSGAVARTAAQDGDALTLPAAEHASVGARIAGHAVLLVATDHGIDVWCDAAAREPVWRALAGAGAAPIDERAAEVVRVESGRPRYGADLDDSVIPQEAGLNDRAVSFTKGCYVGQETVARLHWRGRPNRHLRGLALSGAAPVGDLVRVGEREVGRLSSSVVSPRLGPIGLALIRREVAPGDTVTVGDDALPATVVELPFAV